MSRSLWLALAVTAFGVTTAQAADDKAGIQFFEKHIRPVLVSKCYKCHSAETKQVKGGLTLDTREGTRTGGESGKSVVPGNIQDSLLIEALHHEGLEMPPGEKLPSDVIAKFEQWVKMGAPDPREGKGLAKREINHEEARRFWSLKPITRPPVPRAGTNWAYSDIDRFVAAKHAEQKLVPVGDASAEVLCRRIHFDLTGLPPSPEDQAEFLADAKQDKQAAIRKLVDELLKSHHFGERWGRHWLDVVRYAESTGMERNVTYPHAWKYRDYVIESFNEDKPFDQFVREQVAGDLLPASDPEQRREQLVATGFLAIGPKGLNERNREQFDLDVADDQIDSTFRSFMGLTAGCARCHDHKFDPITTKEYYSLAGVFLSTETLYGTGNSQGNRQPGKLLAFANGDVKPVNASGGDGNQKKKGNNQDNDTPAPDINQIKAQLAAAEDRLEKARKRLETVTEKRARKKAQEVVDQTQTQVGRLSARLAAAIKETASTEPTTSTDAKPEMKSTRRGPDLLMAVLDEKSPTDAQQRLRGEPAERGDKIPRGFLIVGSTGSLPKIEASSSGRLELAQYLVQKENPLTARVAANRVWQHLIGKGIVGSVDNFGAQGEKPTHPELLDYLASQLRDNGWSIKKLIREIILSRSYQLAGSTNGKNQSTDPDNNYVWRARHRRLEVEAIRDAMLMASGHLDLVPPDHGSVVAQVGDADIGRGLDPKRFNTVTTKRSVYLPIIRSVVPEMLQVFDFPEPSNINGQREVTTVATQALYLMNSAFALDQAEEFAKRVLARTELDEAARVNLAYQLALSRTPTDSERVDTVNFATEVTTSLSGEARNADSAKLKAWTALCQALYASAEFRYVE